jgi:hypothetical protein
LFLAMESYRRRYLLEQTDVVLVGFQSHLNLAPIGSVLLLLGLVSHSRRGLLKQPKIVFGQQSISRPD